MPVLPDIPVDGSGASPILYADLSADAQVIVIKAKARMNDLFDAADGGPMLAELSSNFTDDKYALLLEDAIQRINGKGAVSKRYGLDSYPYGDTVAAGALMSSMLISIIRHLILSYTEQAPAEGMDGPYLSRDDYVNRWAAPLTSLEAELKERIGGLDRLLLGSGTSSLIWSNQMPWGVSTRVRPLRPPWWR
jgi:hypothetical protein